MERSVEGPLSGIRVLTVDNYLAGNYGPQLMAMLGAEVIKIEPPGRGDVLRANAPYANGLGRRRSHGEIRLMNGKRSVAMSLQTAAGLELFFKLVSTADVVWSNIKPKSLRKMGVDFEALTARNPEIVYTTVTGFGHSDVLPEGPDSAFTAFDIIAQGLAGLQFRPDGQGRQPVYNGLPIGDQVTSMMGVLGTVLALRVRDEEHEPQRVDVAMYDVMVALNEKAIALYSLTKEVPERGRSATSAPFNAYPTTDGFVNIAVGGNPVWERFCEAIGRPELFDDPRWEHGSDRVVNRVPLDEIVDAWTSSRTTAEVIRVLQEYGVPCAPLREVDEVVEDEQARIRHMILEREDPETGIRHVIAGNPIKIAGFDDTVLGPPAVLGADTRSILSDLVGLSDEEMDALASEGVIAPEA